MSSWKKYKLGELLELVIDHRGKTPKKLGFDDFHSNGYPVLSAKHVKTSGLVNLDVMRFANQEMYEKWMKIPTKKGDIVLTSEAPLGELFYIDGSTQYLLGQRVFGLRTKANLINPMYLFAWLSSPEGQSALQARATGSTVQGIKQSELLNIELSIPDLIEQEKVAEILFNLNNKIQLNTQINQTLEQIAQTIFKSWFIDFDPVHAKANALASGQTLEQATQAAMAVISGKNTQELHRLQTANPEQYQQLWEIAEAFPSGFDEEGVPRGWEERYLKDVCNIVYGKGLPKNKLTEKGFYVFGANGVIGFYDSYTYEKPQVLIGCRGTVGQVTLSYPYSFVTNNSLVIEYENSCVSMYYLEKYLSNINLKEISSGSVQPQITIQNMSKVKILIPNIEILNFYSEKVKKIYDKRLNHFYENQSLSKVRDLLLPKLLSGEV